MGKQIEHIEQKWEKLQKVKSRLQKDYEHWNALEEKAKSVFDRLKEKLGWAAEFHTQDKWPETREVRFIIHHIFPLEDELVAYDNSASIALEQRLSGQVFIWNYFPQKEHFSRLEGPHAVLAGQFQIKDFLEDESLLLAQIESFLTELKGWMLEVLPEPSEEKQGTV